jgi:hypothetical protein
MKEKTGVNLNKKPLVGKKVKVIVEGATIKFIGNFSGDWKNHNLEIPTKIPTILNPEWEKSPGIKRKGNQPSQFIWEDSIDVKNIVAWRE